MSRLHREDWHREQRGEDSDVRREGACGVLRCVRFLKGNICHDDETPGGYLEGDRRGVDIQQHREIPLERVRPK